MLPPNVAILKDQIEEMNVQLQIAENKRDFSWFVNRGINIHERGVYRLLNWIAGTPTNHWNILCRGTVFRRAYMADNRRVLSLPVPHLYGLNTKGCCITYAGSDLIQKVQGYTMCLFWPLPSIEVTHTDTKISTDPRDVDTEFATSRGHLKKLTFSPMDRNSCFTFKITPEGVVYLVAGRDLPSLWEFSENELTLTAARIGAQRPLSIECRGMETIKKALSNHKDIFIIRDRVTGERANVFMPVPRPKKVMNGRYKNLLPFWQRDEYAHIIAQYPETKEKYIVLEQKSLKLKEQLRAIAATWYTRKLSTKGIRDSLRVSSVPSWQHKIISRLMKFHPERWDGIIDKWMKGMPPKQLMKVMGLTTI